MEGAIIVKALKFQGIARRRRQTDRRSLGSHKRVEKGLHRGVLHAFQYCSGEVLCV